jgi:putative ABC transport system substrate-binding protein
MENIVGTTGETARRGLLLVGLLGLCLVQPAGLAAQQKEKIWHIGLCHVGLDHIPPSILPLHQALTDMGYEDGRNMRFDWRNLPNKVAVAMTMEEWLASRVDLIVVVEEQCARAAKAATSKIPIVFVHIFDPVAAGYIESLARPGGNMTGPVSQLDLIGKRLELLKEIDPQLERVLILYDSGDPFSPRELERVRLAAKTLDIELIERDTPTAADLERVFAELRPGEVGGLILASLDLMTNHTHLILDLAERARLPVAAHRSQWVDWGALLAYAPDFPSVGPVAARYIDEILKGADPAELPVEELSEILLTVNAKRAAQLGLTIPPAVLLRATEVIE